MRVGVIRRPVGLRLIRVGSQNPGLAKAALQDARELREALYRILARLAAHQQPEAHDLGLLETAYRGALANGQLRRQGSLFSWSLREDLDLIRASMARDAVALLESKTLLKRLKRCPGNNDCGWLFLDSTKNGIRRWCSMAGCGNRAKARRHSKKTMRQR